MCSVSISYSSWIFCTAHRIHDRCLISLLVMNSRKSIEAMFRQHCLCSMSKRLSATGSVTVRETHGLVCVCKSVSRCLFTKNAAALITIQKICHMQSSSTIAASNIVLMHLSSFYIKSTNITTNKNLISFFAPKRFWDGKLNPLWMSHLKSYRPSVFTLLLCCKCSTH